MQFLVLAVLVGVAVADMDMNMARMNMMRAIIAADPKDMKMCESDADCANVEGKTKCGMQFKLCRPADWPELQMTEGTCTDDSMCKPMRRCKDGMCHFSGPKACMSNTDCLQGIQGKTYECMELAKTAPGKRCFPKCTSDNDCHERITSEEFKSKVGCCGGYCQKKTAC